MMAAVPRKDEEDDPMVARPEKDSRPRKGKNRPSCSMKLPKTLMDATA
jgi:hypothetical protein